MVCSKLQLQNVERSRRTKEGLVLKLVKFGRITDGEGVRRLQRSANRDGRAFTRKDKGKKLARNSLSNSSVVVGQII